MKKYIFNKLVDGQIKQIEAIPERWVWGVIYNDNTELHQFDDEGFFHQIKEIKTDEVRLFTMYKFDNPSKRIDMVITPEIQFFHFYRNTKAWYSEEFARIYCFGYKFKGLDVVDPNTGNILEQKAVYNFILPDDRIIVSGKENIDLTTFELDR